MSKKLAVALVCLALAVSAEAGVNFDQGTDVKSAVKDAAAMDIQVPEPGKWSNGPSYPNGWNSPYYNGPYYPWPGHVSYSRDCRTFNFGPSDAAVASERVSLYSTEWTEICNYVPDPYPYPPYPRTADKTAAKGMQCQHVPRQTFRRTAQLSIAQRKLFPWETESFEVCLEGPYMDINVLRRAYDYGINSAGDYDVQYRLTPQNKIATAPDRDGLSIAGFSYGDGRFTFKVNDRWAAEYAGEKTAVRVELYKDGFWFFDSYKGRKEFTFDAAAGYEMSFAESELDASKSFSPDDDPSKTFAPSGEANRSAPQYYLKWGFKRVGRISTDKFIDKNKTDKIEVN